VRHDNEKTTHTKATSLASKALALIAIASVGLLLDGGASRAAEQRSPLLGVYGSQARFERTTESDVTVGHIVLGWSQGVSWGSPLAAQLAASGPIPLIGLNTRRAGREILTPRDIANGKGDDYLVALNRAVARWGRLVYIRPLAEMNAHWNAYSAFAADGTPRGAAHSTRAFRRAFARIYLILHGGAGTDAALERIGLPPVGRAPARNTPERLRVIWNPQGHGSPNVAGNEPQSYYPGDRFVDVVGNDLYNMRGRAQWADNERLYRAHPTKPYAIPEWSNWGIDDPAFITRMGRFVRTHPRVELIAYYNGDTGSVWDIATKPRSVTAYRTAIASLTGSVAGASE
jgi:hypothetical protein